MSDFQADLAALEQAARDRDPERAQFLLKRLFLGMNLYRALAVAVERVYAFVPVFERDYPDAVWARQIVTQITTLGTAPPLPPGALQDFTAPGAANFMKALSDLAHAVQPNYPPPARTGYLVSAVVNAIAAGLAAAYYGERLDDWDRLRTAQFDPQTGAYSDPAITEIAYRFWTDDAVARRDTEAWLAVAAAVEQHMSRA